ncbi:MAG: hypothetical protein GY861_05775 [bacterium]|nr:hypothetical protein [bacterium]
MDIKEVTQVTVTKGTLPDAITLLEVTLQMPTCISGHIREENDGYKVITFWETLNNSPLVRGQRAVWLPISHVTVNTNKAINSIANKLCRYSHGINKEEDTEIVKEAEHALRGLVKTVNT